MSNLTDTIDQIIHENDLPFDWPEEVLNELDKLEIKRSFEKRYFNILPKESYSYATRKDF